MSARPHVYVSKKLGQMTVDIRVFAPANMCGDCLDDFFSAAINEASAKMVEEWNASGEVLCIAES
jgi:hypothetical protein